MKIFRDAVIPISKWSSNHCPHMRVEQSRPDQTGKTTETCMTCGAVRTIPGSLYAILNAINARVIKCRTKPAGENFKNNQTEVQLPKKARGEGIS
jgi:hypothetical protein